MGAIVEFKCKCGNKDVKKAFAYDGAMGYEALVCMCCGRYYDHVGSGEHEKDQWSEQFMMLIKLK